VITRIAPSAALEAAISELFGDGGQVVDAEQAPTQLGGVGPVPRSTMA
jgi:hypothetical protein